MKGTTSGETGRLSLTGACTVCSAEETHAKLLDMAARCAALEIDCRGVGEVDLSFVQLLLAARTSARLGGRTVRLASPASGVLLEALQRGGFLSGQSGADCAFWLQPESA